MLFRPWNVETLPGWAPHDNPLLAKHLCLIESSPFSLLSPVSILPLQYCNVCKAIINHPYNDGLYNPCMVRIWVVYYCFNRIIIIAIIFYNWYRYCNCSILQHYPYSHYCSITTMIVVIIISVILVVIVLSSWYLTYLSGKKSVDPAQALFGGIACCTVKEGLV